MQGKGTFWGLQILLHFVNLLGSDVGLMKQKFQIFACNFSKKNNKKWCEGISMLLAITKTEIQETNAISFSKYD